MSPSIALDQLDAYNASLAQSLADKLWFANKTDADLWVDFGCADGAVLAELKRQTGCLAIGFDVDPRQCLRANRRGVSATTEWEAIQQAVRHAKYSGMTTGVHFSSVLDEVPDLTATVKATKALRADVIVIRQHAVAASSGQQDAPMEWINAILKIVSTADFEAWTARYGLMRTRRDVLHFLLKAPYLGTNDYPRELDSDYLALAAEDYYELFRDEYRLAYSDHGKGNGYIQSVAYNKFGLYVPDPTHIKLVLERR